MKWLLVLLLFFSTSVLGSSEKIYPLSVIKENRKREFIKESYEYCIPVIKKWEGYRAKKYLLFGAYYIGYGHRLLKSDTLSNITENQADSVLRLDFNKNIKAVKERLSYLPDNKVFVIACLSYNTGLTRIIKSSLWPDLLKEKPDIERKFKSFVFIQGNPSKKMAKRRAEEFVLWNKTYQQ
jgi:GH24 family phage-related lysozyme (muramidase)